MAKSKWKLITVVQKITFSINSRGEGRSAMLCVAVAEKLTLLIRWVFLGQVRSLAQQIFDSIEDRQAPVAVRVWSVTP